VLKVTAYFRSEDSLFTFFSLQNGGRSIKEEFKSEPVDNSRPSTPPKTTAKRSPIKQASSADSGKVSPPVKRARRIRVQTPKVKKAKEDKEENEKATRNKTVKNYARNSMREKTVIRRVRCNECDGCSRDNCNTCRFCLDMKKNGGEGKLRQSCAARFCEEVSEINTNIFSCIYRIPYRTNFSFLAESHLSEILE